MSLFQILVFVCIALVIKWCLPQRWHDSAIFFATITGVAWLLWANQPAIQSAIHYTMTLGFVFWVWYLVGDSVRSEHKSLYSSGIVAILLVIGVLILAGFLASGPRQGTTGLLAIALIAAAGTGLSRTTNAQLPPADAFHRDRLIMITVVVFILVLVIIKIPSMAQVVGLALEWSAPSLASGAPFVWMGFSYLAFRLLALLLDYRAGRIPGGGFELRNFITYALFFPAFTAGPIDRAQRFIPELEASAPLTSNRFVEGAGRISIGLAKKFVIADTLALVTLQPDILADTRSTAGLWLLLYLYSFQIYLDFSGYSDIAIGLGRLIGITLPENFDRPYLQRNLQQFWQRWHITLSTWFRFYFFTPFSRMLIRSEHSFPQWSIVLVTQVSTMVFIGLWHGITFNFVVWGLWHGLGLFGHKMLADRTRGWHNRVSSAAWSRRMVHWLSVVFTFHYVTLGWVFFDLPEFSQSWSMFTRMVGISS